VPCQIYRKAIDDALAGKPFDPSLMNQLEGLANRGYTEGIGFSTAFNFQ
jgi:putative protease